MVYTQEKKPIECNPSIYYVLFLIFQFCNFVRVHVGHVACEIATLLRTVNELLRPKKLMVKKIQILYAPLFIRSYLVFCMFIPGVDWVRVYASI